MKPRPRQETDVQDSSSAICPVTLKLTHENVLVNHKWQEHDVARKVHNDLLTMIATTAPEDGCRSWRLTADWPAGEGPHRAACHQTV